MKPITRVLIAGMGLAATAWGWGDTGHMVVARIAAQNLTPETRARVAALLALVNDDVPTVADGMAAASVWADHFARPHFPRSSPWHYIDLSLLNGEHDPGQPFVQTDTSFYKILQYAAALQTGSPDEFGVPGANLMFLIHFTGDLHQPLHDATNQDRGGNCVFVKYPKQNGRLSRKQNLHSAWDTGLLEDNLGTNDAWIAAQLQSGYAANSSTDQQDVLLADPARVGVPTAVYAWTMEAHQLAIDRVYAPLGPDVPVLSYADVSSDCDNAAPFTNQLYFVDQDYVNSSVQTIDRQLTAGGVRLAALLNATFSPAAQR